MLLEGFSKLRPYFLAHLCDFLLEALTIFDDFGVEKVLPGEITTALNLLNYAEKVKLILEVAVR